MWQSNVRILKCGYGIGAVATKRNTYELNIILVSTAVIFLTATTWQPSKLSRQVGAKFLGKNSSGSL